MTRSEGVRRGAAPDRRGFFRDVTAAAASAAVGGLTARGSPPAAPSPTGDSAEAVKILHDSLSEEQRLAVCFDWDHRVDIRYGRRPLTIPDPGGILLRSHVSNAWQITEHRIGGPFYTAEQRALIRDVLGEILDADWPEKIMRQARDDTGNPWGRDQSLAFFGRPGSGRFQCVITGFHLTIRAGEAGGSASAFGGPISHGHQPSGFYEEVGHPGNIFWHQALKANEVYRLLDGEQRRRALVTRGLPWFEFDGEIDRGLILPDRPPDESPREADIRFRGPDGTPPGLPIAETSADQREAVRDVLRCLLEPYRPRYRDQVLACLDAQGGLGACSLAFYQEHDLGDDGRWDNWRLEGPSFVWFFRGSPHVHLWIHVADDPSAPMTSYFG